MKRLLYILTLFILLCCSKEEETRIFTVTVNAMPPDGGTVTLIQTQSTTGEYKWGENANIVAKPSEGYEFINWTANFYGGGIHVYGGWQGGGNDRASTSLEMRCYDSKACTYDVKVTGNFVKKN
tara:strand:+ start:137 stop:508 length:372 start_codon:yes stop_codon:yes gene_type:complete